MLRVVTSEEMREIDRYAMEEIGIKEEILMENAGASIFRHIEKSLIKDDFIAVLIGAGNNGGDGFVIARYLQNAGYRTHVWLVPPRERVKGCAKYHMEVYESCGFEIKPWDASFYDYLGKYTIIIDALLGTGMKGEVRAPYDEIITAVNERFTKKVISVDVPSGMVDDAVSPNRVCIKATETVTIECPKVSAFLYPNRDFYGKLATVSIGIPKIAVERMAERKIVWTEEHVKKTLPKRPPQGHKGTFGKALIIAGSLTMTGAPVLAAKACHRAGAGLVTVALPDCIHPIVASQVVEATFLVCPAKNGSISDEFSDLIEAASSYDAVAVGPGLSRSPHLSSLIEALLENVQKPLVIDADGLYHLRELLLVLKNRTSPTIITPHSGEMARLIGCSAAEVEQNRFTLAKQFAKEYGVYVLLKGPYTIVTAPSGEQYINPTGNVALAKGGSGDVLTGIILAQVMQKQPLQAAVANAAYIHGKASDILVRTSFSEYDVLATNVIEALPNVFRSLLS